MSDVLGNHCTRLQRARKPHRCELGRDCTIEPGQTYFVGITLPGSGSYPIGGGDYEPVDWPFGWVKSCVKHYNGAMGGYDPDDVYEGSGLLSSGGEEGEL